MLPSLKRLLSLALAAAMALISAPAASAAFNDLVYVYDIRSYWQNVQNKPASATATVYAGSAADWYISTPWQYNEDGFTAGQQYQYEKAQAWNPASPLIPVTGYYRYQSRGGAQVITRTISQGITQDIPLLLRSGKVYRFTLVARQPQVMATPSFGYGQGDTSFEIGVIVQNGIASEFEFYSRRDETYVPGNGQLGNPVPTDEDTLAIDFFVGSDDVQLSVFLGTALTTQMLTASYMQGSVIYPPSLIEIRDITPLSNDAEAVIDAVQETGNRVIAQSVANTDRLAGKLDDLADRMDPQDKPPLADIQTNDPEPLPDLPTMPTPEDIIGADGLQALSMFWSAFSGSTFSRIAIMGPISLAFGVGYIAYIIRKKREE